MANPIPETLQNEICRLYESGMTANAIARLPNMPARTTVQKYVIVDEARRKAHWLNSKCASPEIVVEPYGVCAVSGVRLFRIRDDERAHIVPESIVAQAKLNKLKWEVAGE